MIKTVGATAVLCLVMLSIGCTHAPSVADSSGEVGVRYPASSSSDIADQNEMFRIQEKTVEKLVRSFKEKTSSVCESAMLSSAKKFLEASYPAQFGQFFNPQEHGTYWVGRGGAFVGLVYMQYEGSGSIQTVTVKVTGLDYGDRCLVQEVAIALPFSGSRGR